MTSSGNTTQLRQLYDKVESHIQALQGLKISANMYGCFLTPVLMQKLPKNFRVLVTRDLGSDTWVLTDIMKEIHKELLLKEQ